MIVGIAGKKRAGKDTAANALVQHAFHKESFAAPIRKAVADILGMTLEELELTKEIPVPWLDGVTPRKMMQTFGTEWGREMVHPELWFRSLEQRIRCRSDVVICDVRFVNEADFIHSLGGKVIRVERTLKESDDGHVSETPLPDRCVDFVIQNFGSITELQHSVMRLVASVGWVDARYKRNPLT